MLNHLLGTTNHHAIATFQPPHAATRPDVHIVDALRDEFLRTPNIVHAIGVSPVDENVFRFKMGSRSAIIVSTAAAGTINQTARGFSSFFTKSAREDAPMAFSRANSSTTFGALSNTTHCWPPRNSRRTIFAPILPRPTIPICIMTPFLVTRLVASALSFV